MNILTLQKSDIYTFDSYLANIETGENLEKALFKHAYYSKLVPTPIVGKDGVKRIHWVNPNKDDKNPKLNLVAHYHDGERKDHHKQIEADNTIDMNLLHHFSHGDKVKVKKGIYKDKIGIFVGSYSTTGNSQPRASVKFEENGIWKTGNPVGPNNLELVHRSNQATQEALAPKTVLHTNKKGEQMIVSKKWADKKTGLPAHETPEERHKRLGQVIAKGVLFKRTTDGAKVFILNENDSKLHVKILDAPSGRKSEGYVVKDDFSKMVASGEYSRIGTSTIPAKSDKNNTRLLETGQLHTTGKMTFDSKGQPALDIEITKTIIFVENWKFIERVVKTEASKYPTVDTSEISGVDFIDQIRNAVNTFEPFLGTSLQSRLQEYVKDATRKKATQLHQINVLRQRNDMFNDSTNDPDGSITEKDPQGTTDDIGGGAFVNMLDVLIFHDILADEADMMSWFAGNDEYADVLMRMTGLGIGEAEITKGEAAKELYGKMTDSSGELYSLNTIQSRLSKDFVKMMHAYKDEAEKDPDFAHTLKQAIQYRSKLKNKRDIKGVDAKDLPTITAVQQTYDGGRNAKAAIAKMLIKNGASVPYTPKMITLVENIVDGKIHPEDYKTAILTEYHAGIIEATLKDMMPANARKTPERFKITDWYKYDSTPGRKPDLGWLKAKRTPPKP